jgi:hypothetical protein
MSHNVRLICLATGYPRADVLGMILVFQEAGVFTQKQLTEMGYSPDVLKRSKGACCVQCIRLVIYHHFPGIFD